jgi:hypothetical protein
MRDIQFLKSSQGDKMTIDRNERGEVVGLIVAISGRKPSVVFDGWEAGVLGHWIDGGCRRSLWFMGSYIEDMAEAK